MYLVKLALRPWRQAWMSQVISVIAVALLLFSTGFVFWLDQALKPVVSRLQHEQILTAYLSTELSQAAEAKTLDSIRTSLGASADRDLKVVNAEDFLKKLKVHYPELTRELQDLGEESLSIVPRYVSIAGVFSPSELGAAMDSIKAIPGVESVETTQERAKHSLSAFETVRWVARTVAVGLVLSLFTGLLHLSRMNSQLHRDVAGLLKNWGASAWTLRLPGVFSGWIVGAMGGLSAGMLFLLGGEGLATQLRALAPALAAVPIVSPGLSLALVVGGMAAGVLAGFFGEQSYQRD